MLSLIKFSNEREDRGVKAGPRPNDDRVTLRITLVVYMYSDLCILNDKKKEDSQLRHCIRPNLGFQF
jgi:hypothetical protein